MDTSTVPVLQTRPLNYEVMWLAQGQPTDLQMSEGIWARVWLTALMWHSTFGSLFPHHPGEVGSGSPQRAGPWEAFPKQETSPIPARPKSSQGGLWDLGASSGPQGRMVCVGQYFSSAADFDGDIWPCLETLLIVTTETTSFPEHIRVCTHIHTYIWYIYVCVCVYTYIK